MAITTGHSFSKTYFGIKHSEIPNLAQLHMEPPAEVEDPNWCLINTTERQEVRLALDGINRICKETNFIPYIIELAVIADPLALQDEKKSYFTSFIDLRADMDTISTLWKDYIHAMDDMRPQDENDVYEPIVTHSGLHNPYYGYFSRTFDINFDFSKFEGNQREVLEYRFPYVHTGGKTKTKVEEQIDRFVGRLQHHTKSHRNPQKLQLILIPFERLRAGFETSAMGGCVFVYVCPCAANSNSKLSNEEIPEKELVTRLSWWLDTIMLRESRATMNYISLGRKTTIELAKIRASQAAAWAHDVKNWTNPILLELDQVSRGLKKFKLPTLKPLRAALDHATLNTRFLNVVAVGRNTIFSGIENRITRHIAKTAFLGGEDKLKLRRIIECAFQYLLNLHASAEKRNFELCWRPRWSLKGIEDELQIIFGGHRKRYMEEPSFVATVAFLREVVQNIRITNPVEGQRTVDIDYKFSEAAKELSLCVHQEHIQEIERPPGFPSGLQRANMLYGPAGANLGFIPKEKMQLKNEEIAAPNVGKRAWKISYELTVEFII